MNYQEVVIPRFSPGEIVEIWERLGDGQSARSVAIGLGRNPSAVRQLVSRSGSVPPPLVVKLLPATLHLSSAPGLAD